MVKQQISKFLKQMKFMRKTRAEEIDKEQSELAPIPSSSDEFWVLDVPGLEKCIPEPAPETVDSFTPCIQMRFGRFSVNGHNKELEKMMLRNEENRKMKEIGEIADSELLTEEEMLETYLSLARKNVSSNSSNTGNSKKSEKSKETEENEDEGEKEERVPERAPKERFVRSFRKPPGPKSNGLNNTLTPRKGKVMKKKQNSFTGLARKRNLQRDHNGEQSSESQSAENCVLQSRAASSTTGRFPFNVKSPHQKKKKNAISSLIRQTFMMKKGRKL